MSYHTILMSYHTLLMSYHTLLMSYHTLLTSHHTLLTSHHTSRSSLRRFGRKKAVLIALVVEFFVCLGMIFVDNYVLYAVGRFLIGSSTAGSFTGIFVMSE